MVTFEEWKKRIIGLKIKDAYFDFDDYKTYIVLEDGSKLLWKEFIEKQS